MPESQTKELDYYPKGWTEEVHDDSYIEWVYDEDNAIFVRLEESEPGLFYVSAITGINQRGEEYQATSQMLQSREEAFNVAKSLIYAMNGTVGRIQGDAEFNN
jgi:hypothetical protein